MRADLPSQPVRDSGGCDEREVDVGESRSDDHIPAKIPERVALVEKDSRILDVGHEGGIAVRRGTVAGPNRAFHAGANGRIAGKPAVGGKEGDRVAGHLPYLQ